MNEYDDNAAFDQKPKVNALKPVQYGQKETFLWQPAIRQDWLIYSKFISVVHGLHYSFNGKNDRLNAI